MKIALVVYALNVGGMETLLFELAKQFRLNGHLVSFVVTNYRGAWHEKPKKDGFQVIEVLPEWWQCKIQHAKQLALSLREFDAIFLNHTKVAQSSVGMLPHKTVVVSVLHNNDKEIFSTGLSNIKNIDCVIAVSERVRSEALRYLNAPEKIICINNGMPVPADGPVARDAGSPIRIIFLGRIDHSQKGVFYLPGIFSCLKTSRVPFRVDVVGGGKDLPELKNQLADNIANGEVAVHGALPNSDAVQLLQEADVLLMPSHYEGQPIVLLEAMARGVVPVVSLLKGITDAVVEDEVDGFLVPVGNEKAFAKAIVVLAHERKLAESMSLNAWAKVNEKFNVTSTARLYLDVIVHCGAVRQADASLPRDGVLDYKSLGTFRRLPYGIHQLRSRLGRWFNGI